MDGNILIILIFVAFKFQHYLFSSDCISQLFFKLLVKILIILALLGFHKFQQHLLVLTTVKHVHGKQSH